MDSGSVIGVFVAWLLGVPFSLWVSYLIVRTAVKSGIRWAVQDILADPATKLAVVDIAAAVTGDLKEG